MTSKYLNTVLTVIAVLLGLNLWTTMHTTDAGQALDPATAAHAQGRTDAGQQRTEIIRKLDAVVTAVEGVGDKVDSMTTRGGAVRVEVESMPEGD